LLAIVVSLVLVLRGNTACAAEQLWPADGRSGRATFHGPASPGGACGFPQPPADHLTAAAGPDDYAAAAACGGYLDVTGRLGTVRVKVDNLCPECESGHLDLSTEAFARLDDVGRGVTPISFRQVADPALPGGLGFRVKEGSSQWWLALLVDNHGNQLRSVEVTGNGGRSWQRLIRQDWNNWVAERGAGRGPFRVRVTDVRGHTATATGIRLAPGTVQRTSVRLYSLAEANTAGPPLSPPAGSPSGSAGPPSGPPGSAPGSATIGAAVTTATVATSAAPTGTARGSGATAPSCR